jgi:hypothetical protein
MKVAATASIAAPAESIFTLSQDYSRRLSWDPFLREAVLLGNNASAGVGTRSWCVAWFGLGMESEYVSFDPPKVVAVKMTKGPWILRQFAASWNFRAVGTSQTEVVFLYSFQVQPPLCLLAPLLGAFFRYEMTRRLRSLRRACES